MDLSRLDTATGSSEGRWFEPLDTNGAKVGIRIKVLGPDSRRYATLKEELTREAYRMLADAANGMNIKTKDDTEADKEARFYAGLTLGWESTTDDPVTWDGKPFDFSEANAVILYTKAATIRNQVRAFVESRRNFTRPEPAA